MKSQEPSDDRHLTSDQREGILAGFKGSTAGPPVSMTAEASDKESVCYETEIAEVLSDLGCEVQINNVETETPLPALPTGVEVTIKETTVRPIHANRIVHAFLRVGVAIATRINAQRRNNNTLYVTVGPDPGKSSNPSDPKNS